MVNCYIYVSYYTYVHLSIPFYNAISILDISYRRLTIEECYSYIDTAPLSVLTINKFLKFINLLLRVIPH